MESKTLSFPTSLRYLLYKKKNVLPPAGSFPALRFSSFHGVQLHQLYASPFNDSSDSLFVSPYQKDGLRSAHSQANLTRSGEKRSWLIRNSAEQFAAARDAEIPGLQILVLIPTCFVLSCAFLIVESLGYSGGPLSPP
jgi:hypothetical protein